MGAHHGPVSVVAALSPAEAAAGRIVDDAFVSAVHTRIVVDGMCCMSLLCVLVADCLCCVSVLCVTVAEGMCCVTVECLHDASPAVLECFAVGFEPSAVFNTEYALTKHNLSNALTNTQQQAGQHPHSLMYFLVPCAMHVQAQYSQRVCVALPVHR